MSLALLCNVQNNVLRNPWPVNPQLQTRQAYYKTPTMHSSTLRDSRSTPHPVIVV